MPDKALANQTGHKQTIIINDANWPPFFFAGERDKPQGFAKALLLKCQEEINSHFTFLHFPIERMHKYIRTGEIDSNIYSYKKERERDLIYGKQPLFSTQYKIVTLKESNITVHSLEDIEGLTLGHLAGLKYTEAYRKKLNQSNEIGKVITVRDSEDLLMLLLKKRVDAFVESKETAAWYGGQHGVSDQLAYSAYTLSKNEYYFIIAKKTKRTMEPALLIDELDLCILRLKASGEYFKLQQTYGLN